LKKIKKISNIIYPKIFGKNHIKKEPANHIYNNNYNLKTKLFFTVLLLVIINSCGIWTDFKTYFNTYYNADKLFEEIESNIIKSRKSLFSFGDEKVTGNQKKQLEEVIKKTSAIMQFHAKSSFFDDALLMTGKSFYYQQNYTRALRKFEEVISLKKSDLRLEAQMWIGKTKLKLRNFNKGLEILEKAKKNAERENDIKILTEIYRIQIGYLLAVEKYDEAIKLAEKFLDTNIDDELKAKIQYEIGMLYKKNNNYKKALIAFENVLKYSPSFETEFNSKFELAIMEKENGNIKKSLEMFDVLKSKDKFSDRWGDIDLEVGKVYYKQKKIKEALNRFTIADTTYPKTEAGGNAAYYRGEIIENYYHDYDSAMVFYNKVSASSASSEIKDKALKKSRILNKYLKLTENIKETNQQILYATDEEAFITDSLAFIDKMKSDSLKNAKIEKEKNNLRRPARARRRIIASRKYQGPQRPKISVDSLKSLNSKYKFELGNLLFTEFDNPDSAFKYYQMSLQEKKNNPNAAQIYYALGNYYLSKGDRSKAKEMFRYIYDNYKDNPIMNEAARQLGKPVFDFEKDEIAEKYTKAEAKLDSSNYKEAIKSFLKIYRENPKSKYAAKSLYTIGWIFENKLEKPDSAASFYDTLNSKYRSSEFARAVVVKLTGYKQEQRRLKAIQDSIKKAGEMNTTSVQTDSTNNKFSSVKNKTEVAPNDSMKMKLKNNIKRNLKKIPKHIR